MSKKVSTILTVTFSVLLTLGLIFGLMISVIFVFGFMIGGETSIYLSTLITTRLLPYEYILAEVLALIGMIKMYLCKEKTFMMDINFTKIKEHSKK